MTPPDSPRFIHDGRGLDYWLWELVCDDIDRREQAATVIDRMRLDIPVDRGHQAITAFVEEFDRAVRGILAHPDFNAKGFIEALIDLIPQAQSQRMRLVHEQNKHWDRVFDQLVDQQGEQKALKAFGKMLGQSLDQPTRNEQMQEQLLHQGVTAAMVLGALREELLTAADRLLELLRDRQHQYLADEALRRIGPAAKSFADELFNQLRASNEQKAFAMAKGLAAIIHDDAAMIRSLVDLLKNKEPDVAAGAAGTLYHLGERAAALVPESIDALLAMANRRDWARSCIETLGTVARGTDITIDRLLVLSRQSDDQIKGAALTALGEIARQPNRVVPRLVEALQDYQEQDPDYLHGSEHERVTRALQQFGAAAASATTALIEHIQRSDENELDQGVIETLGKIGPLAREASPILEKLAKDRGVEKVEPDDESDFLVKAINRIRGGQSHQPSGGQSSGRL